MPSSGLLEAGGQGEIAHNSDFDRSVKGPSLNNTVVRKFAILVSFGILVVFMASDLQGNARVWYFL